jgi:aldehyde dehydrogenase (NAD+)
MTIAREEIFRPVLSIMPFDTEEEALRIANGSFCGLTNYVQSSDDKRRQRLRRAGSPFHGVKGSGNGREGGVFGLETFLEVKSISGWS